MARSMEMHQATHDQRLDECDNIRVGALRDLRFFQRWVMIAVAPELDHQTQVALRGGMAQLSTAELLPGMNSLHN